MPSKNLTIRSLTHLRGVFPLSGMISLDHSHAPHICILLSLVTPGHRPVEDHRPLFPVSAFGGDEDTRHKHQSASPTTVSIAQRKVDVCMPFSASFTHSLKLKARVVPRVVDADRISPRSRLPRIPSPCTSSCTTASPSTLTCPFKAFYCIADACPLRASACLPHQPQPCLNFLVAWPFRVSRAG